MPVWDDSSERERQRASGGDAAVRREHVPGADLARAHDDIRAAARKDAADVLARARRDIRQIVAEARREIQEISAQVRAADVQLAESSLPDPSALEAEEVPVLEAEAWMATAPAGTRSGVTLDSRAEASHYLEPLPSEPPPDTQPSQAKAFVALFALAGLVVLTGTVWWLGGTPAPSAGSNGTDTGTLSGAPPEATPSINPAAALTPPERPASRPNPDGLLVELEVQRNTWIRTTVDGDSDGGRIYEGGELIKLEALRDVVVRAGDAGGVAVAVDGGAGRPFGPDGQALTRRFARQQPAPVAAREATSAGAAPVPAATAPAPSRPVVTPPGAAPSTPVASAPTPQPSQAAVAPILPGPPVPPAASAVVARNDGAPTPPAVPARGPASAPPVQPAGAARGAAPVRLDIAASGRQWLDAYHRQDRVSMQVVTAPSLAVNDERRPDQRFPFGLEVSRAFDDEQLHLSGDSAIFSARMIERASTGSISTRISQTWIRRLGQWQLQEARFQPEGSPVAGR